MTLVG